VVHLCTKVEECSFIRYRHIVGVPKFQNRARSPRHAHFGDKFVICGQEQPRIHVHTKFEKRSVIRPTDIERVPKFRNWARTLGHAHLGANLWSVGKKSPGSMYAPNLRSVAASDPQMLRGPNNLKFGTYSWPTSEPICGPRARTAQPPCAHQI